jgi:Mitochondrial carrier protein
MSSYAPDFADPFPRIRRERHVERKHPPREVKNFVAAGVAAALSSSLYNPFDCLKVRWQVLPTTSGEKSLMAFGLKIVREEGLINGLWRPGVGANALGMGLSSGIRFGYYEPVRNALMGDSQKSYQHMVLAGLVTGSVGYIITTPFHLLKTTIQAEKGSKSPYVTDFVSGVQRIFRQGGLTSLYRGAIPLSSRGALFTAGQLMGTLFVSEKECLDLPQIIQCYCLVLGYDGVKTFAKNRGYQDSTYLHVVSAISASFWASALSTPADLVMAKYMSSRSKESLVDCIFHIYAQGGIAGFWRGWTIFFFRLTPSLLTYSTVYEQLRRELGLGYFD